MSPEMRQIGSKLESLIDGVPNTEMNVKTPQFKQSEQNNTAAEYSALITNLLFLTNLAHM